MEKFNFIGVVANIHNQKKNDHGKYFLIGIGSFVFVVSSIKLFAYLYMKYVRKDVKIESASP